MNLTIHGQNVKVTDNLEGFAERKLGKLDRYLPHITDVRLELEHAHTKRGEGLNVAQITLRHERGAILRSEEKVSADVPESMQKAITAAAEKMHRQIERFKGKERDRKRRKGREKYFATEAELAASEPVPNYEAIAEEFVPEEEDVTRTKAIEVIPMSVEEAIEQMELLGHAFFMFLNGKTGIINVVYLRDGGGYGVLVPEQA